MKKTLTRVLSLVLVLAMFVSAVPLTMADNEVVKYDSFEISCPSVGIDEGYFYVPIGVGPITLSGVGTPTDANEALTWTVDNTDLFSIEGNMLTAKAPGSSPVRVFDSDGEELDNTSFYAAYFGTIASNEVTAVKGSSVELPAVTVPGLDAEEYSVVWTVTAGSEYVTAEGEDWKAVAPGTATMTATITSPSQGANLKNAILTCEVTVIDVTTYTPALEDATLELYINDEVALPAITGLTGLAEGSDYTVTWSSAPEGIVEINDETTVKALAEGTATLTATITLLSDNATFANSQKAVALTCAVTVSGGVALEVKELIAVTVGGTYSLKEPTLKGSNLTGLEVVSYKYELISDSSANTELKLANGVYVLTGKSTGRDTLKVTATVKTNNGEGSTVTVPALEVPVSVYAKADPITVMMKDNLKSFIFTDKNVMSSLKLGDTNVLSDYPTLSDLILALTAAHSVDRSDSEALYTLKFSELTVDGGTLSNTDWIAPLSRGVKLNALDGVVFTCDEENPAKATFEYVITDDKGLPTVTGTLYIDYAGSSQIQYATSFNTPVTFEEEHFEKFWTEYGTGENLNYIKFTTLPSTTYGKLWTDANKTTAVTKSMAFITDYYGGTSYYDLDTVTFVPGTRTTAYTVSIPFTAYDVKGNGVSGTITISVSKGTTSDVSSLGMAFGNSSYKLDDKIAEAFKKANGDEALDYLTFTLPAAEYGRLYYNFSDLMDSYRVYRTDKFYYEPAANENVYDLGKVAFVPAAGCKGNVRIDYTATGVNGTVYNGFITLNVTTKTASSYFKDVKSGSYNWASDAVDFLRYHGIVNGTNETNTEFSPANSITRAHFMLMLYRAFLADDYDDFNVTSNFPDIAKGTSDYQKELYQAVGVAKYLGITNGVDGKYLPNKNITREEAMTLIYRTLDILDLSLEYASSNRTSDFSDYNKVSAYAKDPLKYLIEHGVVLGTEGKINPKSNITRAEMAVILHRILTY